MGDLTLRPAATSHLLGNFCPIPTGVVTPINIEVLGQLLHHHPDQETVSYVLSGFRHGFDIGYVGVASNTRPRNLLSADQNPMAVTEAIARELVRGHTSGPFLEPPFEQFHCSPLGAVPKKDGTHRIILDLSSPKGDSINDGISPTAYSVHYSSFDDAVSMVRSVGTSAFLAKLDIKHAFRLCPVRPDQWHLLGFSWNQGFFFDTRLPFGSRSSPFIFNTFADLLWWILVHIGGIQLIMHYLDDFLICGYNMEECQGSMQCMQSLTTEIGVPLADDKTVGPSQVLPFLGIELDARRQEIRLPSDKLHELLNSLHVWQNRKKCTKRELLSLIGVLSFAAKVVKPGRMFLRRLIDLSTTVSCLHHHITLNSESRADIQWWLDFLPGWNGVAMMQPDPFTSVSMFLHTDASGVGFGAVFGDKWFSHRWPDQFHADLDIHIQELFAIVAAVCAWGDHWVNSQILFFTDNMSVTQVWRSGTSKDKLTMKLVRFLFLYTAKRNINILMEHVFGFYNAQADHLSRLQVDNFRRLHPSADQSPTPLPELIWHILT